MGWLAVGQGTEEMFERHSAGVGAASTPRRRLNPSVSSGPRQSDIEDRREEQAEDGHADHAEEHRRAERLAHLEAGAAWR